MPGKRPPVSEPAMVVDTFATGMLPPEDENGIVRLIFVADRQVGAHGERAIVARLTMPKARFVEALAELVRVIGHPS